MAQMKGRNKTVLGLFVDGLDVKLAHLSVKGKRITVNELKSATLATKLHEHKAAEMAAGEMGDSADPFSLPSGPAVDVSAEPVSEDNNAVLLGLLAGYPRNKYSLAIRPETIFPVPLMGNLQTGIVPRFSSKRMRPNTERFRALRSGPP